jgi:RNase H-like domain found in reverse transcriptase/Integrase zinc binding domain
LATDASDSHIGGVLQQKVRGHWQPLGFFSRRLSATEQNYSTFDRELLAAQASINHFLPQVEGRQFQLWTDHKPLVAAMTRVTPPASGRQQRHLAFIAEHTCEVRHTPGVDNVVADALSWPPAPPPPANPSVQVCHVAAAVADSELSPLDLKEMALQQILCQQVQQLLHAPGLRIGFKQVGDLKLWGDVSTGTFRPLVPLPHRRQVFDHLHRPAHPGLRATRCILSSRYVWRGLARDVTAWARECLSCQRGKVHRGSGWCT